MIWDNPIMSSRYDGQLYLEERVWDTMKVSSILRNVFEIPWKSVLLWGMGLRYHESHFCFEEWVWDTMKFSSVLWNGFEIPWKSVLFWGMGLRYHESQFYCEEWVFRYHDGPFFFEEWIWDTMKVSSILRNGLEISWECVLFSGTSLTRIRCRI